MRRQRKQVRSLAPPRLAEPRSIRGDRDYCVEQADVIIAETLQDFAETYIA
jgi:hypothetical protein